VVNYSTVVLVTLVLVTAAIFGLNYLFSHAVNFLYDA
jgi:preprotein translocase subunit SecE